MSNPALADPSGLAPQLDVAAAPVKPRALINRYTDFWMLGGASIALWAVMFVAQYFRAKSWAIDHHFLNLAALSTTLALVVNNPHFIVSYKLAYGRGVRFIGAHALQLVVFPLAMLGVFAFAFANFDAPISAGPVRVINSVFEALHLQTRVGLNSSTGTEVLGDMVILMYLTVGWHYTKQTYGCMMVYASFDKYVLSPRQRDLLRWHLFGIWWLSFVNANASDGFGEYFELRYPMLRLPGFLVPITYAVLLAGVAATLYGVFYRNYKERGQLPSLNLLAPYVALFVWWFPPLMQKEFYFSAVPFFHSLQYLAFVSKVERQKLLAETSSERSYNTRMTLVVGALLIVAFLAFDLVPNSIDVALQTHTILKTWFFFIAFNVFINVHHYFIDNVIWRMSDENPRKYLMA